MVLTKKIHKLIEKVLLVSLLILVVEFSFPHFILAGQKNIIDEQLNSNMLGPVLVKYVPHQDELNKFKMATLPKLSDKQPRLVRWVTVTAYSSTVDQCDNSPFITANGKHVYDGLVATNFLPFGTYVKFPDKFGDKIFRVDDRMNAKYHSRMDIWMSTRQQAKEFGVKYLKVEVY